MIVLERDTRGYTVFFYRDGDDKPVNFKYVREANTPNGALHHVGDLMFSKLEGLVLKKLMKFHELGVSYVVITDSEIGRVIKEIPIEDFIEQFGTKEVLDAWTNDFENI